jgi:hypothetical protein
VLSQKVLIDETLKYSPVLHNILIFTQHFHEQIKECFFSLTAHAIVVVTTNAVHLLLTKFHFFGREITQMSYSHHNHMMIFHRRDAK